MLKGKAAVVTGAARGIGREIAMLMASLGARVVVNDYGGSEVGGGEASAPADEVVSEIKKAGGEAVANYVSVATMAGGQSIVKTCVSAFGRVDIVVNNAGILRDKVLWKLTDDDWDAVLAVHLGGTFRFTRAAVPHFRAQRYGRVVNVTSYTGLHGNVGQANYAAAKAGVIGFTKTAAKELAGFGVTVNAVSPNAETRMISSIPAGKKAELAAAIPMGRFAAPAEMCAAVAFLASAEAGYITGVVLPVDGGMSM